MRKITLTFGIMMFCLIAKSQTPYYCYYKGEKQYLTLSTEYAFLSIKEPSVLDSITQRKLSEPRFLQDLQDEQD